MSARLDHELSPVWEQRMDLHLAGCRRCSAIYASLIKTVSRLRAMGDEVPPVRPSVLDAVSAKVAADTGRAAFGDDANGHTDQPA